MRVAVVDYGAGNLRSVCSALGRAGAEPVVSADPGRALGAALTVIGDGPVGAVGQQLDREFGLPEGHHVHDWAVGMKFVIDLPDVGSRYYTYMATMKECLAACAESGVPALVLDLFLAISITLSILILMTSLFIQTRATAVAD